MKSSDIFDRLKKLTQLLGHNVDAKLPIKYELIACTFGLSLILDDFDTAFDNLFIDSADKEGVSLFADMVKLDDYTADNIKTKIVEKASKKLDVLKLSDFDNAVSSYFQSCFTIHGLFSTIFMIDDLDKNNIMLLSKIIHYYLPSFVMPSCSAGGKTFSEWENEALTFGDYDKFDCPFSVLDTLKGA